MKRPYTVILAFDQERPCLFMDTAEAESATDAIHEVALTAKAAGRDLDLWDDTVTIQGSHQDMTPATLSPRKRQLADRRNDSPTNAEAVETVLKQDYGALYYTKAVRRLIESLKLNTDWANREGYYVECHDADGMASFRLVDDRNAQREVSPTLHPRRFADWLDGFLRGGEATDT